MAPDGTGRGSAQSQSRLRGIAQRAPTLCCRIVGAENPVTLCLPGLRVGQQPLAGPVPDCAEWNTLVEDAGAVVTPFSARTICAAAGGGRPGRARRGGALPERLPTGIAELDRALGGGLVAGSATLIGGDPGIGKSTLLLQAAAKIAARGASRRLYFGRGGGRPGAAARAPARLGAAPVRLAAATSVATSSPPRRGAPPALLVIDSIQTMHST
jgi:DNA repair protein RadA/Sms